MKARLLVIGAHGFVGAHLAHMGRERFACIRAARSGGDISIDITDPASVHAGFQQARPDAVALTAAIADIDRCELDPARARETNVAGALRVARECARWGARLLFTSTGAIFDGSCLEYREDSLPSPVNIYGASKAQAEAVVQESLPDAVIVRLSLVLGYPRHKGSNAVLERLEAAFQAGRTVAAPTVEHRNAIDIQTAGRWMLDLLADPVARGIFHLGASDALPRYDISRQLAVAMGYSPELVVADDNPPLGRAPRGRHEMLTPARIGQFSDTPAPTCRQAIERCVDDVP